MTFDQWFEKNCVGYSSYEDILREAWDASKAECGRVADEVMAEAIDDAIANQEPTPMVEWLRKLCKQVKGVNNEFN